MEFLKDLAATAAEVGDTTARVAFVAGGAWLVGSYAFRVLGALLLEESEPGSGTAKAA